MRKITERKIMYSELEKLENYLLAKVAHYQAEMERMESSAYSVEEIAKVNVKQKVYIVALNTILDTIK